jgi:hypothetical protein
MNLIEEKIKDLQTERKNLYYSTWLFLYVRGINDEVLKDDWKMYIDSYAQVFYNFGRKDQRNYFTSTAYILQDNIPSYILDKFKSYLVMYNLLGYGEVKD